MMQRLTEVFSRMQRILEDRSTPIIRSNLDCFYKWDRLYLQSNADETAQFIWMLHPGGTHLGRIGVLPPPETTIQTILNWYVTLDVIKDTEIYNVRMQDGAINRVTHEQASHLIESTYLASPYSFENDVLSHDGRALMTVRASWHMEGAYPKRFCHIQTNPGYDLQQADIAIAVMYAARDTAKSFGVLCDPSAVTVNGKPLHDIYTVHAIDAPAPGAFLRSQTPLTEPETGDVLRTSHTMRAPH